MPEVVRKSSQEIAALVATLVGESATLLRPDILDALKSAHKREESFRGKVILDQLIKNAAIAAEDDVPICQDTGTVWVRIEAGNHYFFEGDLEREINDAVARVYAEKALRMSVVRDALFERVNTQTNTPVFLDVVHTQRDDIEVSVMLKGAGSDNASRLVMLNPDEGLEGVKREVVALVREKASMACPPLIIGVGVGGSFDKAPGLAKKALLRPLDVAAKTAEARAAEKELLDAVNATGMGPGGLGGDVTALGVHLVTAPCHIAALPVAINMGCSAMRSRTTTIR